MISTAEAQYQLLIRKILVLGNDKWPTKGMTKSVFGGTISLSPHEVPLLLGRQMYYKGIVGELKSFIQNASTVHEFQSNGCNFWGAWANEDGSLDVDYARLLHDFNGVNQLDRVINSLTNNPDSRKHVISLWDPSSKTNQPPCVMHYQWYVSDGKLKMIWSQRSVDVMIGLASDMFSAWLFNQLMAKQVGLEPGEVYMQLGDCHIYGEHLLGAREYLERSNLGVELPTYLIEGDLYDFDFKLRGYNPKSPMKFALKT